MRPLLALIKREFTGYFLSPVGYVTLFFFLLVTGLLFAQAVEGLTQTGSQGIEYPYAVLFGENGFWFVFSFIPPLLTMRLLAEERGTGTLESLLTAPIRDWQVVAGKFIGAVLFYTLMLLPTLLYAPFLLKMKFPGNPIATFGIDPAGMGLSYLGLFMVGMMFLAIGLYVSSLVKNQLVAAMIALAIGLVFIAAGFLLPYFDADSFASRSLRFLSVPDHFRLDFARGILDTRHLLLYFAVTVFCLFMTVKSLEARRLRA